MGSQPHISIGVSSLDPRFPRTSMGTSLGPIEVKTKNLMLITGSLAPRHGSTKNWPEPIEVRPWAQVLGT